MHTKNSSAILLAAITTSRRPPQPELVVIAKGKFDLVAGGPMTLVEGIPQLVQGPLGHDVFAEDDDERSGALLVASDFAEFKPHGEVIVSGTCHAPRGRMVRELAVRASVGRWSKQLKVVSTSAAFHTMPLDYAHARRTPENPVGADEPNVIDPADPKKAASFAPLNPAWPTRQARVGKRYDGDYLDTRFPYYPADFDWRFFQATPSDQWIDGSFRGDEQVTLENLDAEHEHLETQLPGLRIRAFVNDDQQRMREVPMALDTILIDTTTRTATLTWRGLTEARKQLANDVTSLLLASEPLAERPLPEADYHETLRAFEADPLDLDAYMPKHLSGLLDAAEQEAQSDDGVAQIQGLLTKGLGNAQPGTQAKVVSMVERLVEQDPAASKKIADQIAAIGDQEPDAVPPFAPIAPGAKPRVFLREQLELARDRILEARQKMLAIIPRAPSAQRPELEQHLATLDERLAQLDDPQLRELDPTWRTISEDEPGPGADMSGQDLSGRDLRGIDLRGAKLDGAILSKANLRGIDLSGASLKGAVAYKADLSDADLRGADLSQLNAASASLDGANLVGCSVFEAYFKGASLKRANLSNVHGRYCGFPGADLSDARLCDADIGDADFQESVLSKTDLSRAVLTKAFFRLSQAHGANLEGARVDNTSFMEADFCDASFVAVDGARTSFLKTKLERAKFSFAVLHHAFFDDCIAPSAVFFGADLRDAALRRSVLTNTRFDRANLMSADLSGAEVHGATFRKASLYDAKMVRTAGKDCDFSGAYIELTRYGGRI